MARNDHSLCFAMACLLCVLGPGKGATMRCTICNKVCWGKVNLGGGAFVARCPDHWPYKPLPIKNTITISQILYDKLIKACEAALDRIESDIESPNLKTDEGELLREILGKKSLPAKHPADCFCIECLPHPKEIHERP